MNRCRSYLFTVLLASVAHASANSTIDFSIAAQPLSTALIELSKQAGIQVLTAGYAVEGVNAENVAGRLTVDAAVERMLKGSGFGYRFVDEKTLILIKGEAASASGVEGREGSLSTDGTAARLAQTEGEQASATGSSQNEGAGSNLEEIVVTAQKKLERLQDVPVPVTAITGQELLDNGQVRLQDFYQKIPGLSLAEGLNGEPVVIIRGISSNLYANPTVGITIDDAPFGSTSSLAGGNTAPDIDPSDLARIEVLRGPQGTLYGASGLGGLIKFVTLDPSTDEVSGRVQVGTSSVRYGDDLGYNVRGTVNLPLGDTFAVRIGGYNRSDPGYVDNINVNSDEKDVNSADAVGGRVSALWRPAADVSIKLGALYQRDEIDGASEVNATGLGIFQQNALPNTGWLDRKTQAYNATLSASLGGIDIVSTSGYNIRDIHDYFDYLASFNFAGTQYDDKQAKKFSQEIRLSGSMTNRIDWLAGGFYTHERSFFDQVFSLADPVTGQQTGNFTIVSNYDIGYEEYAAFGDLTFHLSDRFNIQLGGRQAYIDQRVLQGVSPVVSSHDDPFTYLLTPQLKISPDMMVYARFASGYRPGGPNQNTQIPTVPRQLDSDTTRNYEIGFKGELLDHLLYFDASLYRIDWQDIQVTAQITTSQGAFSYFANGNGAKSEGVELSVEARPISGLTISSWITYNNSELTEAPPAGSFFALAGDRLPFSARLTGSLSIDQGFSVSPDITASVGATLSYVGDRTNSFRSSATAPPPPVVPSYTKLDLHAGLKKDSWSLSVFANNLTDKRGIVSRGISGTTTFYIPPRTVGLSLAKVF
jgi:outer membrane receptor protein involved in Fe transport